MDELENLLKLLTKHKVKSYADNKYQITLSVEPEWEGVEQPAGADSTWEEIPVKN